MRLLDFGIPGGFLTIDRGGINRTIKTCSPAILQLCNFALVLLGAVCHHRSPPVPPGSGGVPLYTFQCGASICDARASYCEMIKTDVPELRSEYACRPLPSACVDAIAHGVLACECFPPDTHCGFCSVLEPGHVRYFQRTCVGGGP